MEDQGLPRALPQPIFPAVFCNGRISWQLTLDRLPKTLSAFASLLRLCALAKALWVGKRIHHLIIQCGFDRDLYMAGLLVQMYVECEALLDATQWFSILHQRSVLSWNIMIGAYVQRGHTKTALQLFQQMQKEAVMPDKITFVAFVSACTSHAEMDAGKQMHACIIRSGLESHVILGTALLNMYGKRGHLEDAWSIFSKMPDRDIISWNTIIAAHVQSGHREEAFRFFNQMQQEGVIPDKFTLVSILSSCDNDSALVEGKQVHAYINGNRFGLNVVVATSLMNMYRMCGCLMDAKRIFDSMVERDVISWNAMIAAYTSLDNGKYALQLFDQMQQECMIPSKVTFLSILDACANQGAFVVGSRIHATIEQSKFNFDVVVATTLISMYTKCSRLEDARRMFEKMPERNTVTWNAMMAAYAQVEQGTNVLRLFTQMQQEGLITDRFTFASIINACSTLSDLAEGRRMHACIIHRGFESDTIVTTTLVSMYGKCGQLQEAQRMFSAMPKRSVVSWNAMIKMYTDLGHVKHALCIFDQMLQEGELPDRVTFLCILDACTSQSALILGQRIHLHILCSGIDADEDVATALMNMYGSFGSLDDARRIFDGLPNRDIVTWTSMITIYAQNGYGNEVLELLDQVKYRGLNEAQYIQLLYACADQIVLARGEDLHTCVIDNNPAVSTALVKLYGKSGSLEDAYTMFENVSIWDVVSRNVITMLYGQHRHGEVACQLFGQMLQEGLLPVKFSLVSVLSACTRQGALSEGKRVHSLILENNAEGDIVVVTALVDMYGKCGHLEVARRLFDGMTERNMYLWNAMVGVYAKHGHGQEALQLFDQLQQEGFIADNDTFLHILCACNHAGLVDEGQHCMVFMNQDHGMTSSADHFDRLVDLLSRAGQVGEAEDVVNWMPFQPTIISWMILLSACRNHIVVERGEHIAEQMFELDPKNSSLYYQTYMLHVAGQLIHRL